MVLITVILDEFDGDFNEFEHSFWGFAEAGLEFADFGLFFGDHSVLSGDFVVETLRLFELPTQIQDRGLCGFELRLFVLGGGVEIDGDFDDYFFDFLVGGELNVVGTEFDLSGVPHKSDGNVLDLGQCGSSFCVSVESDSVDFLVGVVESGSFFFGWAAVECKGRGLG